MREAKASRETITQLKSERDESIVEAKASQETIAQLESERDKLNAANKEKTRRILKTMYQGFISREEKIKEEMSALQEKSLSELKMESKEREQKLQDKVASLKRSLDEINEQYYKSNAQDLIYQEKIKELEEALGNRTNELHKKRLAYDELTSANAKLESEKRAMTLENTELFNEIEVIKSLLKDVRQQLATELEKSENKTSELGTTIERNDELRNQLQSQMCVNKSLTDEHNRLKAQVVNLKNAQSEHENAMEKLQQIQKEAMETLQQQHQTEMTNLVREHANSIASLKEGFKCQMNEKDSVLKNKLDVLQQFSEFCSKTKSAAEDRVKIATKRAQQAENKQEKIAAQNRQLQSVVNQLKNDLSDLRHQRDFLRGKLIKPAKPTSQQEDEVASSSENRSGPLMPNVQTSIHNQGSLPPHSPIKIPQQREGDGGGSIRKESLSKGNARRFMSNLPPKLRQPLFNFVCALSKQNVTFFKFGSNLPLGISPYASHNPSDFDYLVLYPKQQEEDSNYMQEEYKKLVRLMVSCGFIGVNQCLKSDQYLPYQVRYQHEMYKMDFSLFCGSIKDYMARQPVSTVVCQLKIDEKNNAFNLIPIYHSLLLNPKPTIGVVSRCWFDEVDAIEQPLLKKGVLLKNRYY